MHLSRRAFGDFIGRGLPALSKNWTQCKNAASTSRSFSSKSSEDRQERDKKPSSALVKPTQYFQELAETGKDKETFHKAIGLFLQNNTRRRGHVEFIYAALKCMKEFGVHKDLDTYKSLLNVFPKGTMIPKNMWLADQWYYPRQQECCIEVLDEMEWNGVFLDKEVYMIVKNAFGEWGQAGKKVQRQLYWAPKFKHLNPFKLPRPVPDDSLKLAVLALRMMCRDPATSISTTMAPLERGEGEIKVWIASGQAPEQQEIIQKLRRNKALYVDGPYLVWVRDKQVQYLVLSTDTDEKKAHRIWEDQAAEGDAETWKNWKTNYSSMYSDRRKALMAEPSIHETPEGTILALGATQNSSKDSAAAWISFLQRTNPRLIDDLPVLFRMKHISTDIAVPSEETVAMQTNSS